MAAHGRAGRYRKLTIGLGFRNDGVLLAANPRRPNVLTLQRQRLRPFRFWPSAAGCVGLERFAADHELAQATLSASGTCSRCPRSTRTIRVASESVLSRCVIMISVRSWP